MNTYSSGCQVEFFDKKAIVSYKTVVFKNQRLFNQIVEMKIVRLILKLSQHFFRRSTV